MTIGSTPAQVEKSYEAAEAIARQRMPHLYRVARLFPEPARYRAFCAAYASMRVVDDEVDEGRGSVDELAAWERGIEANFAGEAGTSVYGPALCDALERYALAPEPWHALAQAMRHDLETVGFASYQDFHTYAEGATVAPATVFALLLLMRSEGKQARPALPFEAIRAAVREAAIGCYQVHILRDAQADLEAGRNYFPRDELAGYELTGRARIDASWRPYLRAYALRTRGGWHHALVELGRIEDPMTAREKLMLHLLVEFYGQSLQKIVRLNCDVWSDRHWPDPMEIKSLLQELNARYEPDIDLGELAVRVVEDV